MNKYFCFILLTLLFLSCQFRKPSPFKGYNTDDGIIYYKFSDLGNRKGGITFGKFMEVNMTYSNLHDAAFWNSRNRWLHFSLFIPYDSLVESKNYLRLLLKTSPGDSINIIVPSKSFFDEVFNKPVPYYIGKDSMVKVNVRVVSIMDSTQYNAKLKTHALFARDMEIKEQFELNRYINANKIIEPLVHGIYLLKLKEGTGDTVKSGSMVSISYRGYFFNGKTFDSVAENDPLNFTIGDSAQVIEGLETGIKKMREGEIVKIIIPSHSAFGEKGSSTGIVPPYTTVIYEVTMLKVKDPNNN